MRRREGGLRPPLFQSGVLYAVLIVLHLVAVPSSAMGAPSGVSRLSVSSAGTPLLHAAITVASQARSAKPGRRIGLRFVLAAPNRFSISGLVTPPRGLSRATLEVQSHLRWVAVRRNIRISSAGAFTAQFAVPRGSTTVTIRVAATGRGGTRVTSATKTLH